MKILIAARESKDSVDNYKAALTALNVDFNVKLNDVDVDDYQGLLLPGGGDINPTRYGEALDGSKGIDDELDEGQFEVLDKFVKAGKPVLGICRGCQVINVYFGGTLYQDIETAEDHKSYYKKSICYNDTSDGNQYCIEASQKMEIHSGDKADAEPMKDKTGLKSLNKGENDAPKPKRVDSIHGVKSEEGSICRKLYGKEFVVNSAHHQAVKKLGSGLKITSVADDGVCEGVEHETLPVVAVQWHPERIGFEHKNPDTVDGEKFFEYFLSVVEGDL